MEYFAVGTLVLVILALLFAGGWLLLYNRKLVDRIIAIERPEAMPILSTIDEQPNRKPVRYLDDEMELNLQRSGNGS
jgi:hypothetical protein